jgi:hypothetical protein
LNDEGVVELVDTVRRLESPGPNRHAGMERMRRLLVSEVCRHWRRELLESSGTEMDAELDALSEQVLRADLKLDAAVDALSVKFSAVTRARKRAK